MSVATHAGLLRPLGRQLPEVIKRKNAGVMAVLPARANGIPADKLVAGQREAALTQLGRSTAMDLAKEVLLSHADRAGTATPEERQGQVRFGVIGPDDG